MSRSSTVVLRLVACLVRDRTRTISVCQSTTLYLIRCAKPERPTGCALSDGRPQVRRLPIVLLLHPGSTSLAGHKPAGPVRSNALLGKSPAHVVRRARIDRSPKEHCLPAGPTIPPNAGVQPRRHG